ncbi:hypothetical protein BCD67_23360 [Oscillatoriales cyanobacterium USR001]|nr:hypothetical protein BCD67_23360 [Oscillatoriales cyanobacterium USR001]
MTNNNTQMNEERIEAYLRVIQELLGCENGQEAETLNSYPDLLDAGLVQTMEMVAVRIAEDGNEDAAVFLQEIAVQLAEVLDLSSSEGLSSEYFNFLGELLQAISENPDPEIIYPILQANEEKLDPILAELLQSWALATFPETEIEEGLALAGVIGNFSNLMQQFPGGDRGNNLEIAIAGYEAISTIFDRDNFPDIWAGTQNNLAAAYGDRIYFDRQENLDRAVACYENALQVYSLTEFPEEWAKTQKNLAITQEARANLK